MITIFILIKKGISSPTSNQKITKSRVSFSFVFTLANLFTYFIILLNYENLFVFNRYYVPLTDFIDKDVR